MQPIQTQLTTEAKQYPLGKKPQLNQKQMKNMRMILQSVTFPEQKVTYFYNIVQKQSNMGFSTNQRLLFINVESKAISYLSKIPQGYLPYTNYQEIAANKVKQKVLIGEVENFKCTPLKGKISTIVMEWIDKEKKEKKWCFTLGSSKLMNDWLGLVNSIKEGMFDKEKYDQMARVNMTSPLTSNQPLTPQKSNPQDQSINRQNPGQNVPQSLIGYRNQQSNEPNPLVKSILGYNSPINNEPLPENNNNQLLGYSGTPNSHVGLSNLQGNGNNVISNIPGTPNNSTSVNNYQQINLPTSNTNNNPSTSNLSYQPTNNNLPNYQSPIYPNQANLANNQLISANQSTPKPAYLQGGQLQISRKPKIAKLGESSLTNPTNPQPPPQTFTNYNTSNPITQNNQISSHGHSAKQQNFTPISRNNELITPEQSSLMRNPSEPPGDFVEELKRKRQKNPDMFVLNNELSQKNLNNFNSQPYEELNHPGYFNTNQSHQPSTKQPKNEPLQPVPRVPSQHTLNQQFQSPKQNLPIDKNSVYGSNQPQHKPFVRQKTNQNIQPIVREPSNHQFHKQPSRPQMSRNLQINGISSNQNHQKDHEGQNDNYQGYKPTTSWPESTKNLNKIRSDYLERKASNLGNFQNQPNTTKNDSNRLMQNNYMQPQLKKHKDPSFEKLPKFDSSQSRRQDSLNNLNKVSESYLSSQKQKNCPSFNDIWLQTSNPNKKLQVHEQFITRAQQLVSQIVDQIPLPRSRREFQPIESYDKQNVYSFLVQNMIVRLHFFNQQQSVNDSSDGLNVDAPVLYDNSTYEEIKREFYNYNLILGVTSNEGKIKVPLCCYVEYRGVVALIKADIPSAYKEVEPYTYSDQFQALQNMIKVRFLFNTFNCYESQGYRGTEGRFIVLWNLKHLIPGIPNTIKNQNSYFRKELLLQYDEILEDLESSSEAHAFTHRHVVPEFLAKLQSLEVHVLSSRDLVRQLHRTGLSLCYLPELYKQSHSAYLKRILMSEIVSGIFTEVVRSQLNHAFSILPAEDMHNATHQEINNVVVACAHVLINEFFSYTSRSQNIWKLIVNEASKRYRMIVSKEDVIPGYLLSAIVGKLSLECDFKQKSFLKQKKFFVHENILPREVFITFVSRVRHYDIETICPTYSKCKEIVESQELSVESFENLAMILNLKTRTSELPQYYKPLIEELKTYIANYIPYILEQQYEHLDVYEFMYEEPITYNGIKTAFLAIKWLIKDNQIEKANQIFQIKFHQLSYWLSEYNTAITQFYDFFSMFYASIGDFDESICLAKSSLINMTKVLGPGALPVADKHYQLGNIYFKINKKNQALKEYTKTKQILVNHDKTTIPEYGIILLKIALLCLNFGELTECLANAIEAERIFQNNGGNQNEQIECFEILARVYQITRKQSDMVSLSEACSKTFNTTENPKIMERMLKIVLWPKLTELSSQDQKTLLPLLSRLQEQSPHNESSLYTQSFNYLHRLATAKNFNIKRKLYYYLENMVVLSEEVNRKDLLRKHASFVEKTSTEAQEMIVLIEAVGNLVGWTFLVGSLKDAWYD